MKTPHIAKLLEKSEAERKRLAKKCNRLVKRARHSWARHREHKTDPWDRLPLPVPRLQMTYRQLSSDWTYFEVRYSLITRHFLGHIVEIPMGITRVGPCSTPGPFQPETVVEPKHLHMPFRDGAHIRHDSGVLGIPAFRVHEDITEHIEPKARAEEGTGAR